MEIEFNIAKDAIFPPVGYEFYLGDRALLVGTTTGVYLTYVLKR